MDAVFFQQMNVIKSVILVIRRKSFDMEEGTYTSAVFVR